MQATRGKRELFGGALRYAGLAAAATLTCSASAEFIPSTSYGPSGTQVFGWDDAYQEVFYYASNGAFAPTNSYAGNGLAMTAYAGPSVIGINTTVSDPLAWTITWASVTQYFTVVNTKDALLEWDLAGWDGYVISTVQVYELGVGLIAQYDSTDAPGSLLLTLNAGTIYAMQAVMVGVGGDGDDGFGFVRLTNIPAPGALGMLGLGMIGARRRRRE